MNISKKMAKPPRAAGQAILAAALAGLSGCAGAPSQNILGSYFPSWMICALAGIAVAIAVHVILCALHLNEALPAPLLVYLAICVAASFLIWLAWLA